MRIKVFLIFIAAFLLRALFLEADPSIFLDSGQVGDEGYWLYNARSIVLFGKTAEDDFYHDFAAAPVFSLFSFLSFSVFGVGFWQARLVSALSGLLTLVVAYTIARPLGEKVAYLASFLLGFNVLLLLHNRLAVPESLSILFMTSSILLWIRGRPAMAGLAVAFSLLAKTTAFLFLPSIFLIIAFDIWKKKAGFKAAVKFGVAMILMFVTAGLFLYAKWANEISAIYSTFGSWYRPRTITELWQNVVTYFIHPFWGSPFLFALLILALVNIVASFSNNLSVKYEQRVLFAWLGGSLLLTPFMSQITNARLLPLVVPISLLAAQVLNNPGRYFLKIGKIKIQKYGRCFDWVIMLVLAYPLAIIAGKFALAFLRRMTGNYDVVYLLPSVSLGLVILFWLFLAIFKKRSSLNFLGRFNLLLLLSLPLISFAGVLASYLRFFNLVNLDSTKSNIVAVLLFLVSAWFLVNGKKPFKRYIGILAAFYLIFSLFGVLSFFYSPSYSLAFASRKIANYADDRFVVGFLGHELSLENRSKPIYFAPRLAYVSDVNRDFLKYDPEILLVTKVFDNINVDDGPWPDERDLDKNLIYIDSIDLSRRFLSAQRKVSIDVFKIENDE